MKHSPIWLVEITMPKKLMQDITQGSIELENETVDASDMEEAYDTGMDDDSYKTPDTQDSGAPSPDPVGPGAVAGAPA